MNYGEWLKGAGENACASRIWKGERYVVRNLFGWVVKSLYSRREFNKEET
jgi:hypothetical protein